MEIQTFYDVFGLNSNSSDDDIRRAYRKFADDLYFDMNKSVILKEINYIYSILSDSLKRAQYDSIINKFHRKKRLEENANIDIKKYVDLNSVNFDENQLAHIEVQRIDKCPVCEGFTIKHLNCINTDIIDFTEQNDSSVCSTCQGLGIYIRKQLFTIDLPNNVKKTISLRHLKNVVIIATGNIQIYTL